MTMRLGRGSLCIAVCLEKWQVQSHIDTSQLAFIFFFNLLLSLIEKQIHLQHKCLNPYHVCVSIVLYILQTVFDMPELTK